MPPYPRNTPVNLPQSLRIPWNPHARPFRPQIFDADFIDEYIDNSGVVNDPDLVRDEVVPFTDEEDMKYQRLLVTESRFHPFCKFYSEIEDVSQEDVHFQKLLLGAYTHHHAIQFISKSRVWFDREPPTDELPVAAADEKAIHFFTSAKGTHALYRVLTAGKEKCILLACHYNIHGFYRGDLRFIEVNNRTKSDASKFSCIGHLYPGDYLAVTELAKTENMPEELKDVAVYTVNQETPCVWMARNIVVMKRNCFKNIPFSFIQNGMAVSSAFMRSLAVKTVPGFKIADAENRLFLGKGFDPTLLKSPYAGDLMPSEKRILDTMTASLAKYPEARPFIINYKFCQKLTTQFAIGTNAYSMPNVLHPEEIVELCVLMGQSAAHVVLNDGFDSRGFAMSDIKKENNIVKFTIPNTEEQKTYATWKSHTRIKIGSSRGETRGTIESVIVGDQKLRITARLNNPEELLFNDDQIHVVHQRISSSKRSLAKGFFKNLPVDSNGYKIIQTLYGGRPLHDGPVHPRRTFHYISENMFFELNPYQNEYLNRLLIDKNPLTLANAPFGCGKSVMIAVAAIYSHDRARAKGLSTRELLVTQSNYASVNLVEICTKLHITPANCVRFVNESNWEEMPETCHTPFDSPPLMMKVFASIATVPGVVWDDPEELFQMACYLVARGVNAEELNSAARAAYQRGYARVEMYTYTNYIALFFRVFNPEVVISTFDTLPTILPLLGEVNTVQFDEASQVPESTLISVLSWLPNACFGLVGDIRQLPPFCTDVLTGNLKEYGVGNTMERALRKSLFPQANLILVYRCHPVATSILGQMFYQSSLLSAVGPKHRNTFMLKRPDIWPNFNFPFMIIDNDSPAMKMGTSMGNLRELEIVQNLVLRMMTLFDDFGLKPTQIGVISFYKAQEAQLLETLRHTGIKVGTVDSFQGSEREVMIVCITSEYISKFSACPKRMNVALSRAKQATIIIGNANGMVGNVMWREILGYAKSTGCFRDSSAFRNAI